MKYRRVTDWSGLTESERKAAADECWRRARDTQTTLQPFIALSERLPISDGAPARMPYALKDMFEVAGHRPSWGLAKSPFTTACAETAEVVTRIEAEGAQRVGFARMTALAYEPSGVNPLQGAPLNPWNPDFAPGGSSSGSAVAVAAGCAFVAIGSDTGGSLRIPAQACGITAWKPTWSLVPAKGAMPLAETLDTIGLLARSARDIELLRPVISTKSGETETRETGDGVVVLGDALSGSHPSVRKACEEAIAELGKLTVGITERDGMPLIEEAGKAALTLIEGEAARAHPSLGAIEIGDPALARRLAKGLAIDEPVLVASRAKRELFLQQLEMLLGPSNRVLALPTTPIRTPPLSEVDPRSPGFRPRTLYELSAFARFVNMIGAPAVALPVGFDDRGMPVALQLIARPGHDRALLKTAIGFQACTNWHEFAP